MIREPLRWPWWLNAVYGAIIGAMTGYFNLALWEIAGFAAAVGLALQAAWALSCGVLHSENKE